MSAPAPERTATAQVRLSGDDWELRTALTVPAGPTPLRDLLPLFRSLSDAVVDATINALRDHDSDVSCKKGCGACCRQMVLISEVEARAIRILIEALPAPRRTEIMTRFAEARRRLVEANLLERLLSPERWTPDEYTKLAGRYFREGIACPFLEDESCSIYTERPVTCREYLVTSPPEHCAKPVTDEVVRLRIPLPVFNAVARMEVPGSAHHRERCVPLVVAPEWAAARPAEPTPRPGPEILREFLGHLQERTGS